MAEKHNAQLVQVEGKREMRAECKACGWVDDAFYGRGRVWRRAVAHNEGRAPRDS